MTQEPIIIRKRRRNHHHNHGGAWKIAYADFVTAMMAFFLLMWMVNVATEETKKGIAEYFTTSLITMKDANAGSGLIEGETLEKRSGEAQEEADNDISSTNQQADHSEKQSGKDGKARSDSSHNEDKATELEKRKQNQIFEKTQNNIQKAFNSLQAMEKFKHNLITELTDEGLRIQIVDSPDREMFKRGSSVPVKSTTKLIQAIGKIIKKLPNKINITGHTDSLAYYNKKGYGNWELSSDRANSTRRILEESAVESSKFLEVNGRADRDPYNAKNPDAPENRRVSITILYEDSQKHQQENPEDNSINAKQTKTKSTKEP